MTECTQVFVDFLCILTHWTLCKAILILSTPYRQFSARYVKIGNCSFILSSYRPLFLNSQLILATVPSLSAHIAHCSLTLSSYRPLFLHSQLISATVPSLSAHIGHCSFTLSSYRPLFLHSQLISHNTSVPQKLHSDNQLQLLPRCYLMEQHLSQIISTDSKNTLNKCTKILLKLHLFSLLAEIKMCWLILTKNLNMKFYQFGFERAALFWGERCNTKMATTRVSPMLWELIYTYLKACSKLFG
jgi:hypothetical protein